MLKSLIKYSNSTLADAAGVPVEFIKMLRKGKVDEYSIKQIGGGRAIPTKQILEQKILEGIERRSKSLTTLR